MNETRTPIIILACALAVAITGGGCATFYHKTEEIGEKEGRMNVHFESEHAAQLFQTTAERKLQRPAPKDRTRLGVPFVTFYSKTRVMSENARYNAELRKCDSNGDGTVTEAEARTYWMSGKS